jgi:gamma-glutamyltranspeptidase/glutathione hydrolase
VHSVTVPGVVDGWDALLTAYGTMPLSRLLVPAIDYAANGYAGSEIISGQWAGSVSKLAADSAAARTFLPRGRAPRPGEIFANPNLAGTLRQIASGGRDAFSAGPAAAAIVADMKKRDGPLDERDFREHRSDWVQPISTSYRGYDVRDAADTQGFVPLGC